MYSYIQIILTATLVQPNFINLEILRVYIHPKVPIHTCIPLESLAEPFQPIHVLPNNHTDLRSWHCCLVVMTLVTDHQTLSTSTHQPQIDHCPQDPIRLFTGQLKHLLRYPGEQVRIELEFHCLATTDD